MDRNPLTLDLKNMATFKRKRLKTSHLNVTTGIIRPKSQPILESGAINKEKRRGGGGGFVCNTTS